MNLLFWYSPFSLTVYDIFSGKGVCAWLILKIRHLCMRIAGSQQQHVPGYTAGLMTKTQKVCITPRPVPFPLLSLGIIDLPRLQISSRTTVSIERMKCNAEVVAILPCKRTLWKKIIPPKIMLIYNDNSNYIVCTYFVKFLAQLHLTLIICWDVLP